jgi:hypothetical protein
MINRSNRLALLVKSAATIDPQVHEFAVADLETNLHGLAADLAIFDIGLTTGRQIDEDAHRLCATGAADGLVKKQIAHALIRAAIAGPPRALL